MAPNRAGRIFFLLIQTLPTFWAERIWILRIGIFSIFWTPNFWISRSPDLQISGFPGPQISKFLDFQVPRFPDAAAADGRTLRSQPDPSPNAPRDQIRRKGPCCDYMDNTAMSRLDDKTKLMDIAADVMPETFIIERGASSCIVVWMAA